MAVAAFGLLRLTRVEKTARKSEASADAIGQHHEPVPVQRGEPVSGKVIDEAGTPVGGATVRLFLESEIPDAGVCDAEFLTNCSNSDRDRLAVASLMAGTFAPSPIATTITDDAGTFRFEAAPETGALFVARGRGFGGTGTRADSTILLTQPTLRHSGVVDSRGNVVEGARAWVTTGTDVAEVRPGEHGELEFSAFGAGRIYADAPGFSPTSEPLQRSVVILRRQVALRVHVRLAQKPTDAEVRLSGQGPDRVVQAKGGEAVVEGFSAEAVDGFSSEAVTIRASAPGLAGISREVSLDRESEVTVELLRSWTMQFAVIDELGVPATGATVVVTRRKLPTRSSPPPEPIVALVSAPNGGALPRIGPLPEGEYVFRVSARGLDSKERELDVRPGEQSMEVTLERSDELVLTVVGPNGPVPNVLVRSWNHDSRRADDAGVARFSWSKHQHQDRFEATDDEVGVGKIDVTSAGQASLRLEPLGRVAVELNDTAPIDLIEATVRCDGEHALRFAFDAPRRHGVAHLIGLPPGRCSLSIRSAHREAVERDLELSANSVVVERISLTPDVTIEGRALDRDGRPLIGTRVLCDGERSHAPSYESMPFTNAQGRFRCTGLHAGERTRVSVGDDSSMWVVAPATDVLLRRREQPKEEQSRSSPVEGEVVDADGAPVAGALVDGACHWPESTDAAGRFHIELAREDAKCMLLRASRGGLSGTGRVTPGEMVKIAMARPTHVSGLVSVKGIPAKFTDVWASVNDSSARARGTMTDEEGRYDLDLAPGLWRFRATNVAIGATVEIGGAPKRVDFGESSWSCSVSFVGHTSSVSSVSFLQAGRTGDDVNFEDIVPGQRRRSPCGDYRVVIGNQEPDGGMIAHVAGDETIALPFLPMDIP